MKSFVKFFQDISFRRKLIIIYTLLVTVVIFVVGLFAYRISIKKLEESEKNLLFQSIRQTNNLLDFEFDMYIRKSDAIFSNTILQRAISKDYTDANLYEVTETYRNQIYDVVVPVMQDITNSDLPGMVSTRTKGMHMIKVIIYALNPSLPKDGGVIKGFEEIQKESWVNDILDNPGTLYWRGLFKEKDNNMRYISVNRVLKTYKTYDQIGILSIMIPETRIKYLLSQNKESKSREVILIDGCQNVIRGNPRGNDGYTSQDILDYLRQKRGEQEGIDYYTIGNEKFIIAHFTSNVTGWKLVGLYPYSEIIRRMQPVKYAIILVLVIGIILSVIITIFITKITTGRLERIMKKIERLKLDRYAKLEKIPGADEIGQLDRSFNEMIASMNLLVEKEKTLQEQKASLQLALLQSQINPHILYNTLATISWRARKAGVQDICNVTEELIKFFRYYLNGGKSVTSIRSEIEMVEQYIEIIRFTYNMNFDTHINIQKEVYDYYTLNLVLQPIVENALIHGLRPLKGKGILKIEGTVEEQVVFLTIQDNGIGMEKEMAKKLGLGESADFKGGYGLYNVIQRIRLYLGEPYGIQIKSEPFVGTTIEMRLPALTEDQIRQIISTVD